MANLNASTSSKQSRLSENADLRLSLKKQLKLTASLSLKLDSVTSQGQRMKSALEESEKNHEILLTQALIMQENLRRMARQVLTAQEEERRHISRELHDEIAQTLAGINLRLTHLKRDAVLNTKGIRGKIAYTQRLVEKSVGIVQRFARELRPALLDDLGLIPALNSYINGVRERKHLIISLVSFRELEHLDVMKRTIFYRVAQEAIMNIVRHADAKNVKISFRKRPKSILMEIRDNGIAFDAKNILFSKTNKRLGVLGMRERVEMVGGTFKIESEPGNGTCVSAEIPFSFDKIAKNGI